MKSKNREELRERERASVRLTCDIYEGVETSASGSLNADLDITAGGIYSGNRIEHKYTEQDSFSFSKKSLKKQRAQAAMTGEDSFRTIEMLDNPVNLRYVLIEEWKFLEMWEEIKEYRTSTGLWRKK